MAKQGYQVSQTEFVDLRKPFCDEPVEVKRRIRSGGLYKGIELFRYAPCRKCEKCLLFRRLKWKERMSWEITQGKRTWFVTLTFAPTHMAGVYQEARSLPGSNWHARVDRAAYAHVQRYLKRLRKYNPKLRLRYCAVFELGKNTGRPHYHLLIHEHGERPVSKRSLEEQWRSHVHARLVRSSNGAAGYLSKYLTKDISARMRASLAYGQKK